METQVATDTGRMFKVTRDNGNAESLVTNNDNIIGATGRMKDYVDMNIDEAVNQLWFRGFDVEEV